MSIKKVHMKKRKRRNGYEIWKLIWINIRVLPTGTRSIVGKASARQAEDLCSSPSVCQIIHLFRCVLSSLLPLRSVRRSHFDKGLLNFITLIQLRHLIMILLYCIMESTVDSNEHNYQDIMSTKKVQLKKKPQLNVFEIWKLTRIKIRVLPTGTRNIVGRASAWPGFKSEGASDYSFIPLRSFRSATIAKHEMVQFRQGYAQFYCVDSITTSNNDIAILHNGINCGQ